MRKNLFKKIMALGLAGVMVIGMSTVALADNTKLSDEKGTAGAMSTTSTTLTVNRALIVENEDGSGANGLKVAYPGMSVDFQVDTTYTVPANTTVTGPAKDGDPTSMTVDVKTGPTSPAGITITDGSLDAGTVTLNAKGQEVKLIPVTITVTPANFPSAGIYRFKIVDNTATTYATELAAAGIVKGSSVDDDYFLDVYITDNEGTLAVGGFVLEKTDIQQITTETGKESGFDEVKLTDSNILDPSESAPEATNYFYQTYNVELKKVVSGAMGDKKNGFPFTATVENNSLGYGIQITGNDNATLNDPSAIPTSVQTDGSFTKPLSNNGTLKIWGLSPFAKVNYSEKNNTSSQYQTKIDSASGPIKAVAGLAAGSDIAAWNSTQPVASGYALAGTKATKVAAMATTTFTNSLEEISPTGVALRFGPYIIIIGAAIALFGVTRRRKNSSEA